jgi:energy-coupling factor transporter ATP-binding protein EcfA2
MGRESSSEPLLKLRGIDKHFGAVQALYQVNLDLPAGQVTGLCGDNGAGKSVLTRCIAGVHQIDHGQIFFEGQPVHIRTTRDAAGLGIETVYQDLALCDNLDIVQNLFLGHEKLRHGLLDESAMEIEAARGAGRPPRHDRPLHPPAGGVTVRWAAPVRRRGQGGVVRTPSWSSWTSPPPPSGWPRPRWSSSWCAASVTAAWR